MARVNPDTPMGLLAEQPLEGQIALLRTLEQASDDSLGRAALLYEIGAIIEEKQADESLAIREYLAAFNSAPQFRPPLYALIRIFERRRSFQNLLKLYEAEANSAVTAREKASALVDSAVLLEDHLNQSDLGRAMFEEAAALDPSLQATWLMLERSAWRLGDKEGAERAVLALSEHVEDPSWHAVLRVESAVALNQHGRVDEAIQLLRLSAKHEGAQSLYWQQLEAIAREHGRPRVLIDALEQQAKYWGSSNQSEGGTGAPSAEMVAALWAEAARYRSRYDNNADPMLESFGHAVAELPNDVALMLDMSVRLSGTPHQQEALLYLDAIKEQHPPAPLLGALSVLEGEILEDLGRHALAQQALERAVAACPDSRAAALLLENHIRKHHTPEARIDHLLNQSATHADHSFRMRWEAAQIAAHELGDAAKSRVLHQSAASVATESTAVLRELYGHLLRLGDLYAAREVATTLLRHELEDVERSALLRDQYELLRDVFGDLDATQELLTEILKVPAAADWAPDAARVFAAMNDNSQLCGMAHETLASRSSDPRLAAAHYCASARSYVRAENQSAAVHALRQSLLKVPHHSYATALIQHLVQTGERSRDLIALFRETAFDSGEPNGLESSLLLTAFEAELNQDYQTAIQTYLQLHQLSPHGVAASWHLRRLALRLGRRELLQQGLEGLYSREESQQRPGLATLELAEFRDLVSRDPEAASPLLASLLHHPDFGPTAAIMVLTQPLGAGQLEHRLAAVSRILPKTGGVAHIGLQREWISLSLASLGEQNLGVFSQAVETLIQRDPRDFYGHLMRLRTYSDEAGTASLRADGLMDIARATTDTRVAADLMLHAVRTKLLSEARDAQGDAVIYAHEIDAEADPMAAAVAFNETLGGGDDPQTRSDAFQTWTHHAGPEWSASARAALGRTLATAGRYADAVQVLGDVLTQDETDLSSWEALQHAARHAGMWRAAARACDVLSEHATGSLKTQLLEESALIWLNELEDENAAELRFVHALDLDPSREVAYEQYYRLLRTRGDTLRLLDLLKIRLTAVTNDKERGRLYYEQALLFRSIGNLEGCKEAVLHMLESEPAHVGGLALLAETLTVLEQWDSAIVVLRQLAQAQVPASQQRLCRLAAANILERKKRDPVTALAELCLLEQKGDADDELLVRIAQLAERIGHYEEAVVSWTQLARRASGAERASYEKRLARIYVHSLNDRARALDSYQKALEADPGDVDACEELVGYTLDSHAKHQVTFDFRQHVYRMLGSDPLSPDLLRCLLRAATWSDSTDRKHALLDVLVALGVATREEQSQWSMLRSSSRPFAPRGVIEQDDLDRLMAPSPDSAVIQAMRVVSSALQKSPAQELKRLGVERSQRVRRKMLSAERDELMEICGALGCEVSDLYLGGYDRQGVRALADGASSIWILGSDITSPFTAVTRFAVGRLLFGLRTGFLPFANQKSDQTAAIMFDVAEAMQIMFSQNVGYLDEERVAPRVMDNLSGKARKQLATFWSDLDRSGQSIIEGAKAIERGATRTGLLLTDDLSAALRFLMGPGWEPHDGMTSSLASDLASFWVSEDAAILRQRLGTGR